MRLYTYIVPLLLLSTPMIAAAGSQTFTSSGTFTVPSYTGTLTVTVNGAGGSGADGNQWDGGGTEYYHQSWYGSDGFNGGSSSFGSVQARGGEKGYGYRYNSSGYRGGLRGKGADGTASGGDINTTGGGAQGGAGGEFATPGWIASDAGGYNILAAGSGGRGGRAVKSYTTNQLPPGGKVSVVVGAGGAGGTNQQTKITYQRSDDSGFLPVAGQGEAGGVGTVYITWTDATASSPTCSVTFDQNPLVDSSTTMRWSSTDADLFYINGVGYVGASGSAQVYQVGDYSGSVTGPAGAASCHATLNSPGDDSDNPGGSCVSTSQTCNTSTGRIIDNCGAYSQCANGCSAVTNQCISSCVSSPVCDASGTKVINSCNGSTVSDCAAQGRICSAGVCIVPSVTFIPFDAIDQNGNTFTSSGHLAAAPTLVGSGGKTHLYWNVGNALDCSVSGNNGDGILGSGTGIWNTFTSGVSGKTSSPLMGKTTFTLLCHAKIGAIPSMVQESVTVNVAPSFQEL